MQRKFIKLLALVTALVTVLTISLAGCGGSDKKGGDATPAPSAQAEKKPVTLKVLGPTFPKAFPNGIQTDDVAKVLEEKTGVTIDWTTANSLTDISTYMSTLIASEELPDILFNADAKVRDQLLASDSVISLDELVETNGPDIKKNAPVMIDFIKKSASKNNDGKLWNLKFGVGEDYRTTNGLQGVPWIRWDLYKELGMPPIKNHDDLLNVLKQMQDKFPTAPNGKKAYALSGLFGDFGYVMPYYWFVNENMIWGANFEFDWTNPDKAWSMIDPRSQQFSGAEFFNKAYKMGILDPDSATMKFEQYKEKVAEGRVYCEIANWLSSDVYNPVAVQEGYPERGFEPVPGWYMDKPIQLYAAFDAGWYEAYITKDCQYPDRAMDWMNYLFTYEATELILNGIEGKHWNMVDGKPQIAQEVIDQSAADPDYTVKSGVGKYGNITGLGTTLVDPVGGYPVNFRNMPEEVKKTLTQVDKDYCQTLGIDYPCQPWYERPSSETTYSGIGAVGVAYMKVATDQELIDINTKTQDFWNNNFGKLIFADDYEAAKAKFIEDQKALGYDKLADYYLNEFKKALESARSSK